MTSENNGSETAADAIKETRPAYFPETNGFADTRVFDRYQMNPGMTFDGPAIVEERESTVIVGPGAKCVIDKHHNLVINMPSSG